MLDGSTVQKEITRFVHRQMCGELQGRVKNIFAMGIEPGGDSNDPEWGVVDAGVILSFQLGARMRHAMVMSGVLAMAGLGQVAAPGGNGQVKTVRFDESSTAHLVLEVRGEGVQIYTCVKGDEWAWKLKGPEATLFDENHKAIGKHFAGPTWRLDDGSEVQGKMVESKAQAGTIPWLILAASTTGGKGQLSRVDAVRRRDTQGGVAPATGCDALNEGTEVRVPYSAVYSFFDTK
jgi:hypothetical protein